MLELVVTNQFKKDLKRIRKQGKDLNYLTAAQAAEHKYIKRIQRYA
jgi:mRNA-degrading endonuclease YafQ of YafQ-DinJ toxin-antitoxin module